MRHNGTDAPEVPVPRSRLLLLPVLAAVLVAGCTAGSSDDTTAASSGSGGGEAAAPPVAPDEAAAPDGTLARVSVAGSAVVRTGELRVAVDDVRAAADRAAQLVRDAGGSVSSERTDAAGAAAAAELVLRVPPDRFDAVVSALADLGEERVRTLGTEEVGEELVDLETRLAAQRASVERVRVLLDEAADLGQVVQIEGELTKRTADLESLEARLAALRDRVDLSTITLRLDRSEDGAETEGEALPGFLDGLRGGWDALLATGSVAAAVAGALLPFLPLLLVGWLVVARLRRRPAAGSPASP